jgi:hypothetical protein
LEKEFEDGHREDLSKNSFTNAKQSEIRAKMPFQIGEAQEGGRVGSLKTSTFFGVCRHGSSQSWKIGLMCH